MTTILSFAIKITVSTFLIYLSINIVDRGNYRNKLSNALVVSIILSLLGMSPFIWIFGLVAWVYILINWYSIGFFKSFLCVFVYAILMIALNIFLAAALLGGAFAMDKMLDIETTREQWQEFSEGVVEKTESIYNDLLKRFGIERPSAVRMVPEGQAEKVIITFKNGRSVKASILMEGKKGYIIDIADGRSEVVIRKDEIAEIKHL